MQYFMEEIRKAYRYQLNLAKDYKKDKAKINEIGYLQQMESKWSIKNGGIIEGMIGMRREWHFFEYAFLCTSDS